LIWIKSGRLLHKVLKSIEPGNLRKTLEGFAVTTMTLGQAGQELPD
jgi:hypothetical protein